MDNLYILQAWYEGLHPYAQWALIILSGLIIWRVMGWLMPRRAEVVKRKVRGEGADSRARAAVIWVLLGVGLLWLFGLPPFAPWWDFSQRATVPPRSVPFVVEDRDYFQYPICPQCGRRHQ
jgi:hypothetical protein